MSLPPEKGPLTKEDYRRAAERLGCDPLAIEAFGRVESKGAPFLPSGEPVILFERHRFDALTKGRYRGARAPGMPAKYNLLSEPTRTPRGGYGPVSAQHLKLQAAVALGDRDAALMACSWGQFQVMGENWATCGCSSLQDFLRKAYASTAGHLELFVGYVLARPRLVAALIAEDWDTCAELYNGKGYARDGYHLKARDEIAKLRKEGPPA